MKRIKQAMIDFAIDHARTVVAVLIVATLSTAVFLPRVVMDTDPENMLEKTEPVRVFHNRTKTGSCPIPC